MKTATTTATATEEETELAKRLAALLPTTNGDPPQQQSVAIAALPRSVIDAALCAHGALDLELALALRHDPPLWPSSNIAPTLVDATAAAAALTDETVLQQMLTGHAPEHALLDATDALMPAMAHWTADARCQAERLLIALHSGSADADVRRRACMLLDRLYAGCDPWHEQAALRVEVQRCSATADSNGGVIVTVPLNNAPEVTAAVSSPSTEAFLEVVQASVASEHAKTSWNRAEVLPDGSALSATVKALGRGAGVFDYRLVLVDAVSLNVTPTRLCGRIIMLPAGAADHATGAVVSMKSRFATKSNDGASAGAEVVQIPLHVAAAGYNRRYLRALCHELVLPVPEDAVADAGYIERIAMEDGEHVLLNYRSQETCDLLVEDMLSWVVSHPEIKRVHLFGRWPSIAPMARDEMQRLDDDGRPHYDAWTTLERPLLDQSAMRWRLPVLSDRACPLLLRAALAIWRRAPHVTLSIDCDNVVQMQCAALSGFLPVDTQHVAEAAMKATAQHDRMPFDTAAVTASRLLMPRGALWFVQPVSPLASQLLPGARELLRLGPWLYTGGKWQFSGTFGHCRLRALDNRDSELHYVAAFARFDDSATSNPLSVSFAMCAVNLGEGWASFRTDMTPLSSRVVPEGSYILRDAATATHPPQLMTGNELLHEHHFVDLQPHGAIVWIVEPATVPNSTSTKEQSALRLIGLIKNGVSPRGNQLFELLRPAFFNADAFARAVALFAEGLPAALAAKTLYTVAVYAHQTGLLREPKFIDAVGLDAPQATVLQLLETVAQNRTNEANHAASSICKAALALNTAGPIVFVTPEIGRFSTVGGVGVVVDELSKSMAKLGYDVIVISPYYNYDKYGSTGSLNGQGFTFRGTLTAWVGGERQEFGVHEGVECGVRLVFLHNFTYFSHVYAGETSEFKLRVAIALARSSLEACCFLGIVPSVVLSNDWATGLVPACASQVFGTFFSRTKFLHCIHNAEKGYDGRLHFDSPAAVAGMHGLHLLPDDIMYDPSGDPLSLSLTAAALRTADNWATVSCSYRDDLRHGRYSGLLCRFPNPFAQSNGIRTEYRLSLLRKIEPKLDHWAAKRLLQKRFFGYQDPSVPVFSFVGRICEQKGVELLAHVIGDLVNRLGCGRVQFIVGGLAPHNDPYAMRCAAFLNHLNRTYPQSVWANPGIFFTDGALVNIGSDFGLMPSNFEPSGVVQQEFFVAGTPVVAFKTGGLKDTVFEFNRQTLTGNGFTFEAFLHEDLRYAIERALSVYSDQALYQQLRANAAKSVLDMERVAAAWIGECCRLANVLPRTPFYP